MKTANIHEAKTHLSQLLEMVSQGEEIVIKKFNKPIARLSSYEEKKPVRNPGSFKEKIKISSDFDETDEVISGLFEKNQIFPEL